MLSHYGTLAALAPGHTLGSPARLSGMEALRPPGHAAPAAAIIRLKILPGQSGQPRPTRTRSGRELRPAPADSDSERPGLGATEVNRAAAGPAGAQLQESTGLRVSGPHWHSALSQQWQAARQWPGPGPRVGLGRQLSGRWPGQGAPPAAAHGAHTAALEQPRHRHWCPAAGPWPGAAILASAIFTGH
jgi:hypothetical protein